MPASTSTSSPEATASSSPSTAATMEESKVGPMVAATCTRRRSTPGALSRQVSSSCKRSGIGSVGCSSTAGAGQLLDEERDALGMPDDHGAPIVGKAGLPVRLSISRFVADRSSGASRRTEASAARRRRSRPGWWPRSGRPPPAAGRPGRAGRGWRGPPSAGPRRRTGAASARATAASQSTSRSRVSSRKALGSSSGAGCSAVAGIPRSGPRKGTSRPGSSPTRAEVVDEPPEPVGVVGHPLEHPVEQPGDRPQRDVGVVGQAGGADHPTAAGLHPVEDLRDQPRLADPCLADDEEGGRAPPGARDRLPRRRAAGRGARRARPGRPCGTAPPGSGRPA